MTVAAVSTVHPDEVHERLGRHVLTDGFKLVLDPLDSQGSWIVDARTGEKFLDLYSFFASAPWDSTHRAWSTTRSS